MLFPTLNFAIFFLVVFTASWLLMPHRTAWKWFMLAASWYFYANWDWRFVALIAGSSLVNQIFGVAISRTDEPGRRKALVTGAVATNLAVLGVFKYYGFFAESVADMLGTVGVESPIPFLRFILPVGISFLTFHAISYVVDIYRGELAPAPALDFFVYMAFFPHLVAGPIVRGSELLPQFRTKRNPRKIEASLAFWLIMAGLAKKIVIADFLATNIVDGVFATPGRFSAGEVLAGLYGYAVQIYCDFSAYTDIAIGVALLLGFHFPENFNSPYAATSIQDFWRRWHITLSRWLRDYLYIPLGGSRGSQTATYRNLMLTMLLGGLWHGAAWNFVFWGGLHGAWLVWERRRADRRTDQGLEPLPDTPGRRLVRRIITLNLVIFAWIFFRADSMSTAFQILGRLTDWGPAPAVTPAILLAIAVGIGAQYVPRDFVVRLQAGFSRWAPAVQGLALAVALVVIDSLGSQGVAAFIYFQF
jgi:D-alanyl-lipoteichoic acid acyltransferase DltB (MBOAT superfamily)